MKQFTLLSILALLILSACAPSAGAIQTAIAQTQAVAVSDEFAGRINTLLQEGATLNAMAIQGVSFQEYRQQLARVKGAFSVALSAQTASNNMPPEVIDELNHAFMGWDLALSVWDAKLNGAGPPQAPDAVRYPELVDYVGLDQLPFVGSVPGEGPVDQDRAISILLTLAVDHFGAAQDLLLEQIQ